MELINEFTVTAPIDTVWRTVGDLEKVAGCLPGAVIDDIDGDSYRGRVSIKVGPISLGLGGSAQVIDRDDAQHRMVVRGAAHDRNGQGSAAALITVAAVSAGPDTAVRVVTDLELSGRIAQFGAGLIRQVSSRIVGIFVKRLNALVANGSAPVDNSVTVRPDTESTLAHLATGRVGRLLPVALVTLAGALFGWALGQSLTTRTQPDG